MSVPCSQCIGCRLEYSRQWALRISHEASLHERNAFLTLTFDEDPISLDVRHLQLFFKRMRNAGLSVRHYSCGEYGENLGRPHYHVCLFGEDFRDDGVRFSSTLWWSPELERLWTHGYCVAGALTFESAAYVSRYVTKKVRSDGSLLCDDGLLPHYTRMDPVTGELHFVEPEFAVMSRGGRARGPGGIGSRWFQKFMPEVKRDDSVLARGYECKPPRYYDNLLRKFDEEGYLAIKDARRAAAARAGDDNSDERLIVRQEVCEAKLANKARVYEA